MGCTALTQACRPLACSVVAMYFFRHGKQISLDARLLDSSTCLLELGILRLEAAALLLELEALPPVGVKAQHGGQRQLLDGLRQEVPEGRLHQLRPLLPEARLHDAVTCHHKMPSHAITSPLWPEGMDITHIHLPRALLGCCHRAASCLRVVASNVG